MQRRRACDETVRLPGWLAPVLVFGLALAIYGLTAPPGLTWAHDSADGGDLVTAALVVGVPHPTGYPTWTLMAALLSQLPLGAAAWRATLLSMLSGAAAAALVTATVPWLVTACQAAGVSHPKPTASLPGEASLSQISPSRLVLSLAPAMTAGLALAGAPLVWAQATVAEVYALHAGLAAATLWALVRWHCSGDGRWAAAAGLFLGLGLGNHLTTAWLLPAAGILLWAPAVGQGQRPRRWRAGVGFAVALVAGLLVYLYLPLAAAAAPPVNWGNPRGLDDLWWLVSGQLYWAYAFAVSWPDALGRLGAWADELWRNLLPWGLAAALLGLATLLQRNRWLAMALSSSLLLGLAWAIGYNTSDSLLTLLPGWVILALAVGVGTAVVIDHLAGVDLRLGLAAAWASMLLVTAPAVVRWPEQDLRHDHAAEQFYSQVLESVLPGAVVFTAGDRATFALWYGHYGLGLRPDVALVSRDLWALESYRTTVATHHPDLAGQSPPVDWIDLVQKASRERPLYLVQASPTPSAQPWPALADAGYRLERVLDGPGWQVERVVAAP